ncbi:tetratricopeptide repeat protein [Undibacterium sp. Ji50W]|uniref:tetratricopeptide repeat protein n=1 Tax=Undibacterium sp. Ji50W TaxID=3413041 RepID=UPI003BF179A6
MKTVNIPALLEQALAHHQQGQSEQAEALYLQVLQLQPAQFDALQLLGVLARQRGDAETAVKRLQQAIAVNPQQAIAHCNLGAALQDLGRSQEAVASYDRALLLKPDYAMACNNRGNALRSLGQTEQALASYDQALQITPAYPEALLNRGLLLQELAEHESALPDFDDALALRNHYSEALFARAVSLQYLHAHEEALQDYDHLLQQNPRHSEAWCNRGMLLQNLQQYEAALHSIDQALAGKADFAKAHQQRGHCLRLLQRNDEAITAYQNALAQGANAEQIRYALAALGTGDTPAAAPPGYVAELFDQYADHFDRHLLDVLGYTVPDLLAAAIQRHRGPASYSSLDLGCGTGLCAPSLRHFSNRLVGVDLSEKMLAKARNTGLYDSLHCADITSFLLTATAADYDLIVAADVFVYIGDLQQVFAEVSRVLRHGGLFAFSAEAADTVGKTAGETANFCLRPSHRYAHAAHYLQLLAQQHGFIIMETQQEFARRDHGEDIAIHIMLMQKI